MKWFSSINVGQHSGYKQLNRTDKDESNPVLRIMKTTLRLSFSISCEIASYGLLPVTLLFYTDLVYRFHLQYLLGVIAVIFLLAFLYKLQDRLLYHPEMPPNSSLYVSFPTHVSYETVTLTTDDRVKLRGFFIKTLNGDPSTAPTIIYFHGNAGNAGSPCVLPLASIGANVLITDYRGYGKSSGSPSERGVYLDGKACIDYVTARNDVDPNKIILFGHSMGGAVAIHLAALAHEEEYRIAGLIIENTFTTLPHAAKHIFRGLFPGISRLPMLCYSNKFLSIEKISAVRVPTLFIFGEKDEIVPPEMTRTLFNASSNPHKILMRVPNGTHNDTWCVSKHYHRFISLFLGKVFNGGLNDSQAQSGLPELLQSGIGHSVVLTWKCEVVAN